MIILSIKIRDDYELRNMKHFLHDISSKGFLVYEWPLILDIKR